MVRGAVVVAGLSLLAVGCGGSKEETKADAKPTAPAEALVVAPPVDELVNHCVKLREQLFLCKDQGIEMLMEERAKADPTFAATYADSMQRPTLREQGLKELEADGSGALDARQAKCRELATKMPQQVPTSFINMYNSTAACWDKPCADRVNCLRPFVSMMMQKPKAPAQ